MTDDDRELIGDALRALVAAVAKLKKVAVDSYVAGQAIDRDLSEAIQAVDKLGIPLGEAELRRLSELTDKDDHAYQPPA